MKNEKKKPRKQKWGVRMISVDRSKPDHIVWSYESNDIGWVGYLEVYGEMGEFVRVSTGDYESTASFPSALIDDVIRGLRAIKKSTNQTLGQERSR